MINVKRSALALGVFCLISGHAFAQDHICDYVKAFERAPFERDDAGREKYRWIEMHWIGAWMDFDHGFHLECRHSPDNASKAFCAWLIDNTSFEFSEDLPIRILTCHRYRFPDRQGPSFEKEEFSLYSSASGEVLLKTNFQGHKKPDAAIRLIVFPQHQDVATEKPMPPMIDETENPVVNPFPWDPDH